MKSAILILFLLFPKWSYAEMCSEQFLDSFTDLNKSIEVFYVSLFYVRERHPEKTLEVISKGAPEVIKNCENFQKAFGAKSYCATPVDDEMVLMNADGFEEECALVRSLLEQSKETSNGKDKDPKKTKKPKPGIDWV